MRTLFLLFVAVVFCTARVGHALDGLWLAAVDGDWHDATNWSTDPFVPEQPDDTALLNAVGAPHTITVSQNVLIDTVLIDSPDATLLIDQVQFTANGGIEIDQGTLWLRGGTLFDTRVEGIGALRPTIDATHYAYADQVIFDFVIIDRSVTISNSAFENSIANADVGLLGQNTASGHIEINGLFGGRRGSVLSLAPGTTLGGTGTIGNTTGRFQGQTLEIVDPQFTLPAGLSLIAATQYDTTDIISAPNTALRVDSNIVVGFENSFPSQTQTRSDSMSFDVASLETTGSIHVTVDGTMNVTGGDWNHSGVLTLDNGLVIAEAVTVAPTGSVVGDGSLQASGGLLVEGSISPGANLGTLAIDATDQNGDLQLLARTGDLFDVDDDPNVEDLRTINAIGALESSAGTGGQPTNFSDDGRLAIMLGFSDFTSGVFVFDLSTSTPADLNGDGFVDGLDLGILLGNFNMSASPSGGELNDTPPVDGLDLGILLGAWNPPALVAIVGNCGQFGHRGTGDFHAGVVTRPLRNLARHPPAEVKSANICLESRLC